MLASINPLGERARNQRWNATASCFAVGATAGGSALGALCAALGHVVRLALPDQATGLAAVGICAAAAIADAATTAGAGRPRLPSPRRQVDERWLTRYRGWVYGVGFGVQLGAGVVTIVTTATVYACFALAGLSGAPAAGALVGGAFGLTRALPLASVGRIREPAALRRLHRRVADMAAAVSLITVAAAAAAAGIGLIVLQHGRA